MELSVQPEDRDRFTKILIDAGFQQDPLYPDTFRRGAVLVDLHTHPLGADRIRSRRYLLRTESAKLFHRARPVNWAGTVLHCPADFDQLVLVSVHALKHGLHRLGWLSDVVHLTGQWEAAKWRLFERWCKKTGGARAVGAVFAAVETLQGGRGLLPETADRLKKPLGQKDRKLVLLREKRAHLPFFVSVWLMRPEAGIFRSAVFFFETFFPRPAVLRQSFPAFSRFPAPFLYALRILQVAAGLLGRRRSAGSGQIPQRPSS